MTASLRRACAAGSASGSAAGWSRAPAVVRNSPAVVQQPLHQRQRPLVTHVCRASSRRPNDKFVAHEAPADVGRIVEEASAASHGLFNDSFKSALATTLSRQGTDTLLAGQEKFSDEGQLSGQENVLKVAIMSSNATLLKLQMIKSEVEKAIELETKQVERLQFALQKARSDAAYYRGVLNVMDSDTDY